MFSVEEWTNMQWLQRESEWPTWSPSHSKTVNLSLFEENDAGPPTTTPRETTPSDTKSAIHLIIDVSRYSSSPLLLSVTAYVYRFLENTHKDKPRVAGSISTTENKQH